MKAKSSSLFSLAIVVAAVACLSVGQAWAMMLDQANTTEITGHFLNQEAIRLNDSSSSGRNCVAHLGAHCTGFTAPKVAAGQLIQQRNLVDLEFFQDVAQFYASRTGREFPFLDTLSYRLRVKYFYDSLYDIGPRHFRVASDSYSSFFGPYDKIGVMEARHYDTQHDPLWNAYLDIGKGRFSARIGRQDLSWGESDGFRLLDMIEPLDNRFGFPLVESLDDRRIPLWMVRPTVRVGDVGPFHDVTLDGFWVPGSIDYQISPLTPGGNPFAVAAPPGASLVVRPNKNLENSRGGGRIIFKLFHDWATISLGHYVTFNDNPSAQIVIQGLGYKPVPGGYLLSPNSYFLVKYYQQQITGGSASFALPFDPLTICRMEIANFWDEKEFDPAAINTAFGQFLATGRPATSVAPTHDVTSWMIGFDRNVWFRWLNPTNTFFVSVQYFDNHINDYSRGLAIPAVKYVDTEAIAPGIYAQSFGFVPVRQDEVTFTYLVNTFYDHGKIVPQVFGAYDPRGVSSVVPSVLWQVNSNLQLSVIYSFIAGKFTNLGLFQDRDEVAFKIVYNIS